MGRRLSKKERFKRKLKKISLWDITIYPFEKILGLICNLFKKIYFIILQIPKGIKKVRIFVYNILVKISEFMVRFLAIIWFIIKLLIKGLKWIFICLGATTAICFTCIAYIFNTRKLNIETHSNGIIDEL